MFMFLFNLIKAIAYEGAAEDNDDQEFWRIRFGPFSYTKHWPDPEDVCVVGPLSLWRYREEKAGIHISTRFKFFAWTYYGGEIDAWARDA